MGRRKPKTQPTRVASGGDYGERKAMVQAQEAAPMPVDAAPQAAAPRALPPGGGAFGPTDRPLEPPTAGMPFGPGPGPAAPEPLQPSRLAMLRRLNEVVGGDPDIERLIARYANG